MEKARKWKMGDELYEQKGWSNFVGHSSWEIWDGDGWMYYANQKDFELITALKDRGTLPRQVSLAPVGSTLSSLPKMAELEGDYSGMV
jgi:hypothetical protein